ncbi:MAG: hydroxymethylbilane synthase [Verrucomicrobiota bacterium]
MTRLVYGTRGSALALAQAELFESALQNAFPSLSLERKIIQTTGDRRSDLSLKDLAAATGETVDKGVFIKELETALQAGEIQVAVHSLKDLPSELPETLALAAVLPRADPRDVLVSKRPELVAGDVIGTSSVRRARLLLQTRPGLRIEDIRGNVPTRLRKVAQGPFAATLLAKAGLDRLGARFGNAEVQLGDERLFAEILDPLSFVPAGGQGIVGLEVRAGDQETQARLQAINHGPTWQAALAERAFLRILEAGCHTPVGVHAHPREGGQRLRAVVFPEDDGPPREATVESGEKEPERLAQALFDELK